MRRLLYLALALVLLALTSLAFVGVTNSGAYVARARYAQIHIGMTRAEVWNIMSDVPDADTINGNSLDIWDLAGGYELCVEYDWPPAADQSDWKQMVAVEKNIIKLHGKRSLLDDILEYLGYPVAFGA